jgi:hypothetical protein
MPTIGPALSAPNHPHSCSDAHSTDTATIATATRRTGPDQPGTPDTPDGGCGRGDAGTARRTDGPGRGHGDEPIDGVGHAARRHAGQLAAPAVPDQCHRSRRSLDMPHDGFHGSLTAVDVEPEARHAGVEPAGERPQVRRRQPEPADEDDGYDFSFLARDGATRGGSSGCLG